MLPIDKALGMPEDRWPEKSRKHREKSVLLVLSGVQKALSKRDRIDNDVNNSRTDVGEIPLCFVFNDRSIEKKEASASGLHTLEIGLASNFEQVSAEALASGSTELAGENRKLTLLRLIRRSVGVAGKTEKALNINIHVRLSTT